MAEIVEPLRPVRVLHRPKKFPALRSFSCGRKGSSWEKSVNDWARELYLGKEREAQTVVVVEDAAGRLIGIGSFRPEALPVRIRISKPIVNAQCVHMLGIDRLYRGARLADGLRPGDILLQGVLDQIKVACDERMPYVWALVNPDNEPSHDLFSRHGFSQLPHSGEGEIIRVRHPHKRSAGTRATNPGPDRSRIARWIAGRGGRSREQPQR